MHGALLNYLRNGFTILEMVKEFDKRLKYVGIDVRMQEISLVFEKRLKYVGNDVDMWERAKI